MEIVRPDDVSLTIKDAEVIADLRKEFQFFNQSLSQFSDKEIKAGVMNLNKLVREMAISAEQMSKSLSRLTKSLANSINN